MATYKRSSKSSEKNKANSSLDNEDNIFSELDKGSNLVEGWVVKNQKLIYTLIAVVLISVFGYNLFDSYVSKPKEIEANKALYLPKNKIESHISLGEKITEDNIVEILEESEESIGLKAITEVYKGTSAANLAYYYMALCYLDIENYDEALNNLQKFKANDIFLSAIKEGLIGDIYTEKNNYDLAISAYQKAISASPGNELTSTKYLYKKALVHYKKGDYLESKDCLEKILLDFPNDDSSTVSKEEVLLFMGRIEKSISNT